MLTRRAFFRLPVSLSLAGTPGGLPTPRTAGVIPLCSFDAGPLTSLGPLVTAVLGPHGQTRLVVSHTHVLAQCQTCRLVSVIAADLPLSG
jgi:hypothetical protein